MNSNTQNQRIAAITEETLVMGVDVGSEVHFTRGFDWRKIEYTKKAFKFTNSQEGFNSFKELIESLKAKYHKKDVYVGMEPTGHYWLNLANYLKAQGYHVVIVNPMHVKRSKEMDDNSPAKNDRKDPRVIAGLVIEGRYSVPYIPEGIYADLRVYHSLTDSTQGNLTRVKNRIARWFSIYFPNFKDVYRDYTAKSGMLILKTAPLPDEIIKLGEDGVNKLWREAKIRGVGPKRAHKLVEAAKCCIGMKSGQEAAKFEILQLIEDFESLSGRLEALNEQARTVLMKVPNIDKLLAIKGVGFKTALGFVAEVGDIKRFKSPKEIQKLAGLSIVNDESCKHVGEHHISYRGRKRLRYVMYEAAISAIGKNKAFKAIHEHYTTRAENQLKKIQSVIAVGCKLIRIFYEILVHGTTFDADKMLKDISWYQAAV